MMDPISRTTGKASARGGARKGHRLMSSLLPEAPQASAGSQAEMASCAMRWAGHTHRFGPTQQSPIIVGLFQVSEALWAPPQPSHLKELSLSLATSL